MRDELYSIIFNFMSADELVHIAHEKMKARVRENDRPYVPQKID
jgi:hypothetical protein